MSETMSFTLPGTPIGKGRPRFSARNLGNGKTIAHVHTDAKTQAAEQSILAAYLTAGGAQRAPHDGAVHVEIVATFLPAESWPKWKREMALAGKWPHTKKPDSDNCTKALMDALNGRAYLDDAQITDCRVVKLYGAAPSTAVVLTFVDMPTKPERGRL